MKFGESDGEKPKPKGALAVLLAGAPASDAAEAEPDTDHGFRAVAKAFGIPPEREASAQAALKQYIEACASAADVDDTGEL